MRKSLFISNSPISVSHPFSSADIIGRSGLWAVIIHCIASDGLSTIWVALNILLYCYASLIPKARCVTYETCCGLYQAIKLWFKSMVFTCNGCSRKAGYSWSHELSMSILALFSLTWITTWSHFSRLRERISWVTVNQDYVVQPFWFSCAGIMSSSSLLRKHANTSFCILLSDQGFVSILFLEAGNHIREIFDWDSCFGEAPTSSLLLIVIADDL